MKNTHQTNSGSAIMIAVLMLAIISLVGATVVYNCTTRYNAGSKQIKAWNEALYAAEAGSEAAFAEIRNALSSGTGFSTAFPADGWSVSGAPTPGPAYSKGPITFHTADNRVQQYTVTVDRFTTTNSYDVYRIRSTGTATMQGLRRTGMDDRLLGLSDSSSHFADSANLRGVGDSLVRKIDIKYDHFLATYGDGDGNSKSIQAVANPQVSRRIETIAVPQWVTMGALKATGNFDGPGSAGLIDSYDSKNGAYTFVANNPASPLYQYSQNGDVSVATSNFTEGGPIYGNVSTNGGNVTHSGTSISGTIDNNVPFTAPALVKPAYPGGYSSAGSGSATISPSQAWPTIANPNFYVINGSSSSLTINPYTNAGKTYETHVTVVVNGDLGNVTIAKGVVAQIYFTGNMSAKASNLVNNNVDGTWTGVYQADGATTSALVSRAGAMQFYGISPIDGSYRSINIGSPGNLWATIYAPSADIAINGNPDWYGAIVCHNFSGNGNTGFHYDMEIPQMTTIPIDYQLASYIEDIR